MKAPSLFIAGLLILVFSLAACGGGTNSQQATAQAISDSVSQTATAAAGGGFGTNLETAQTQATLDSQSYAETQAAAQSLSAEALAATATASAPFIAELPNYGVDPAAGRMGWIHPPVTLDIQGYLQYDYANRFIGTVASDFVVSADITWNTSYGTSGCGFVLRSDGKEDALSQYLAIATRGGTGRVIFSTMQQGEVKNVIDNYAYGKDPLFDWQNGVTNRLTVVARDEVFTLYTNGTKIGEVTAGKPPVLILPDPPSEPPPDASEDVLAEYQNELSEYDDLVSQMQNRYRQNQAIYQPETPFYDRGFVALVALSESGRTVCEFSNAWLWIIEE